MRATVALAAALAACGDASNDWPNDVVLTSAHFRYHARHGDVLCDDLLAQLEHNLTVVSRVLGFDPAAVSIDYYKYRDKADLQRERVHARMGGPPARAVRRSTLPFGRINTS